MVGLAVAVLAVGVALLRERSSDTPLTRLPTKAAREDTTTAANTAAALEPSSGEARVEARTMPAPVEKQGPTLTVVAADDGRLLAGAHVRWLDSRGLRDAREASRGAGGIPDEDAFATQLVTDERGEVRLPYSEERAVVAAWFEELAGQLQLAERTQGTQRIALAPAPGVFVLVHKPGGEPAARVPLRLSTGTGTKMKTLARASTDERGRANVAVPRDSLDKPLTLDFAFAHVEMPNDEVPRAVELGETAELTLPPASPVRVRVVDGNEPGRGASGSVHLFLESANTAGAKLADPEQTQVLRKGEALFPFVGAGLHIRAEAALDGYALPFVVRGESGADFDREVVMTIDRATFSVLAMRLLDESGAPILDAPVSVQLSRIDVRRSGPVFSDRLDTDADGRLRVVLPTADEMSNFKTLWIIRRKSPALIDLTRPFGPGETQLGDIQLGSGSVMVAGRVVDELGRPVEKARIDVRDELQLNAAQSLGQVLSRVSDADGNFRILGITGSQRLMIEPVKSGMTALAATSCAVGDTGIELVLVHAGSVSGRILLPADVPMMRGDGRSGERSSMLGLSLECVDPATEQDARHSALVFAEPTGRFHADALRPGTWKLTVGPSLQPFEVVEDVHVVAGEETQLAAIDLRERVRMLHVETVDERGEPIAGADVSIVKTVDDTTSHARGTEIRPGVFEFIAPRKGVRVLAMSPCRASVRIENVVSDQRVVLHPGVPVRIVAKGAEPLTSGDFNVRVEVRLDEGGIVSGEDTERVEGHLDARRELAGCLPKEGRYYVQWSVDWPSLTAEELGTSTTSTGDNSRIEVRRTGAVTTLELTPPAGILERGKASYESALERKRNHK